MSDWLHVYDCRHWIVEENGFQSAIRLDESIKEFNSLGNLFIDRELKKGLQGNAVQKKWYLVNLSRWHMTRVAN